mmetsp:Transcript_19130/g.48053  ORF Transcript_19130/g.48053 Transcript_19130/m.48053 type:complete len:264 (-) Transcript_19130:37-828(-)
MYSSLRFLASRSCFSSSAKKRFSHWSEGTLASSAPQLEHVGVPLSMSHHASGSWHRRQRMVRPQTLTSFSCSLVYSNGCRAYGSQPGSDARRHCSRSSTVRVRLWAPRIWLRRPMGAAPHLGAHGGTAPMEVGYRRWDTMGYPRWDLHGSNPTPGSDNCSSGGAAVRAAAHLVRAGQAGNHRRADLVLARVRIRALLFLLALLVSKAAVLGVLVDVMAVHGSTLAGELSHAGVERDDAVALRAQRGGAGKNRCGCGRHGVRLA